MIPIFQQLTLKPVEFHDFQQFRRLLFVFKPKFRVLDSWVRGCFFFFFLFLINIVLD